MAQTQGDSIFRRPSIVFDPHPAWPVFDAPRHTHVLQAQAATHLQQLPVPRRQTNAHAPRRVLQEEHERSRRSLLLDSDSEISHVSHSSDEGEWGVQGDRNDGDVSAEMRGSDDRDVLPRRLQPAASHNDSQLLLDSSNQSTASFRSGEVDAGEGGGGGGGKRRSTGGSASSFAVFGALDSALHSD
jgi:hypothetical protein